MKKLMIVIGIIGGCILSVTKAQAQDNVTSHNITMGLPEVALLATTSGGVNLTLSAATVAGEAVQSSISDSSAYVQFSSVISDAAPRTLSAKFTGTLPGGTTLTARVLDPNANTVGTFGTPVATDVTLTTVDATLVSDIGSCYSGTAYRMKYTWGLDNPSANYADIRATASASLIVTLTLTAAL